MCSRSDNTEGAQVLYCPPIAPYAAAHMESAVIPGLSRLDEGRKLIPALFHLYKDGQMPEPFRVVGFARREKTDASWF